ncbi:probable NAD(P)H dehydrogenase (quinone) FQR1-like 1 [Andrographis paniculata]|uniref:probable NAD(P)H dehydrogenase (quinone) FQR1-like 1 n=1 Tax=Andrographis paniculata TaxID=175694 RepID=UPI0021E6EA49|nr:probable NAD(P)H dehydrogenase (quinone) FQR1-like 1 [Andrographis paniculata]
MGKGGGCVPSKQKSRKSATLDAAEDESAVPEASQSAVAAAANEAVGTAIASEPVRNIKLLIVFYSMYGHVEGLAKRMKRGADCVDGVDAVIYRVPETLDDDVLTKMRAPPKDDSIPVLESVEELAGADGFLFGFPTRYGCMAAQMKAFFDSTGQLWRGQNLAGKPAGFFVSTGTQGGGQETTAWTAITQLAHHGMLFVPIGYTFGAGMFKMDAARGGTPYGAGVFAGDGTREPSETELALAEHQGKYMAAIVKRLALG